MQKKPVSFQRVCKNQTFEKGPRHSWQVFGIHRDWRWLFLLVAGVESGKIGRKVGVNLPLYSRKGSVVNKHLKVKSSAKTVNLTPLRRGKTETNSYVLVIQGCHWSFEMNPLVLCHCKRDWWNPGAKQDFFPALCWENPCFMLQQTVFSKQCLLNTGKILALSCENCC